MYIDAGTILNVGSIITALGAIVSLIITVHKFVERDKKQTEIINGMQGELTVIVHGLKGALQGLIEQASVSLPDEDALDGVELFPAWTADKAYEVGQRVRYGEKLFKCVQAHTSQEGWEPDATPALWTEVAKPGEIPVWRQPTGAQDAYMMGDKVHYPDREGPVYVSTVDSNVWQPGVYGWEVAAS